MLGLGFPAHHGLICNAPFFKLMDCVVAQYKPDTLSYEQMKQCEIILDWLDNFKCDLLSLGELGGVLLSKGGRGFESQQFGV